MVTAAGCRMVNRRWCRGVAIAALGAFSTWACTDATSDPAKGNGGAAGKGGTMGSGGSASGGTHAGAGGTTGGGGASSGGAGGATANCPPHTLAELCAQETCPESPEDVVLRCGPPAMRFTGQFESSCGGISIAQDFYFGSKAWHFDEKGKLVSVIIASDAPTPCSSSGLTVYGKACTASGSRVDLCAAEGGAGGQGGASEGGAGGH
jgi:hypothetical protein